MTFPMICLDTGAFSARVVSLAALNCARGPSDWKNTSNPIVKNDLLAILLDEAANNDVGEVYLDVCDGKSNCL